MFCIVSFTTYCFCLLLLELFFFLFLLMLYVINKICYLYLCKHIDKYIPCVVLEIKYLQYHIVLYPYPSFAFPFIMISKLTGKVERSTLPTPPYLTAYLTHACTIHSEIQHFRFHARRRKKTIGMRNLDKCIV